MPSFEIPIDARVVSFHLPQALSTLNSDSSLRSHIRRVFTRTNLINEDKMRFFDGWTEQILLVFTLTLVFAGL